MTETAMNRFGHSLFGFELVPELHSRELPFHLRHPKLRQRIHGGFTLTRADDRTVTFIFSMTGIQRFSYWAPRRAVAAEHQVVLDRQFQPRTREFAMHRRHRGKFSAVGSCFQL